MSNDVATMQVGAGPETAPKGQARLAPPTSMEDTRTLPVQTVQILAADFNGESFDGRPFKPIYPIMSGMWFTDAVVSQVIRVERRGGTDYAWFGIKDEYGNITWAGPGDYVTMLGKNRFLVIAGKLAELFNLAPMVGE